MKKADAPIKRYTSLDFILIAIAAVCAGLIMLSFFFKDGEKLCVKVYQSNELIYTRYLDQINEPLEYEISGEYSMTLLIENDGVTIEHAECPDKICQGNGKLTQAGQSAVCVPAGVVIILDRADGTEIDGVAR